MTFIDEATRFLSRRRYGRRPGAAIASGIGLGIGLSLVLGPGGARRRALVRDKFVSATRRTGALLDKSARDLRNRSQGLIAETEARLRREEVSDGVLVERVRAKLGRVVSHPHAIVVQALDGQVILSGPILAHEVDSLLSTVADVRGVENVSDQLEVHSSPDGIPSLQGASRRTGERFELLQENWTPSARVLMGALGLGLVGVAMKRRDPLGLVLGALGGAVFLRGVVNRPIERLLDVGGERWAVDFQEEKRIEQGETTASGEEVRASEQASAGAR